MNYSLSLCCCMCLLAGCAPTASGNLMSTLHRITRWATDAEDLSHLTSYAAYSVRQALQSYLHTIRGSDFGRHIAAALASVGDSRDVSKLFVQAVPAYVPSVDEGYAASCGVDSRHRTLASWQRCLCGIRGAIGQFRFGLRNLTTLERGRLVSHRYVDGEADDELCRRAAANDGNHAAAYCVILRASRALRELDTKLMTLLRLTKAAECTHGTQLAPGPTWQYPQPFRASVFAAVFRNLQAQLESVQRSLATYSRR